MVCLDAPSKQYRALVSVVVPGIYDVSRFCVRSIVAWMQGRLCSESL